MIGSTITFRYQELSDGGIPRFPSFVRLHDSAAVTPPPTEATKTTTKATATAQTSAKAQATPPKATAAKSAATPSAAGSDSATGETIAKRSFQCTEDGASKFWEIWLAGADLTTSWGKIGTNGQEKTKSFATPAKAKTEYDKLIAEKTGKGYEEC